MARTTSISFPSMFDVSSNRVGVLEDNSSVVNRCRLLILTEPTELYNSPEQGVGLKRHLWKYNTDNEKAIIKDRIVDQLRRYEPCCEADKTSFADGLLYTGSTSYNEAQSLKMTVGISTVYGDDLEVNIDGE